MMIDLAYMLKMGLIAFVLIFVGVIARHYWGDK